MSTLRSNDRSRGAPSGSHRESVLSRPGCAAGEGAYLFSITNIYRLFFLKNTLEIFVSRNIMRIS